MTSSDTPISTRRRRPTLATMIALVALVIALSTNADALPGRGTVETNDIQNGAVTTPKLHTGAVSTPKLRNGAVTAAKIGDGAVTAAKIRNNSMWALVNGAGTVLASSGVTSVTVLATGFYGIEFAKPVSQRALVASIYNDFDGNGQANVRYCDPAHPGYVSCFGADSPTRAMVNTEDSAGANAAKPFLVVALPATQSVSLAPRLSPRRSGEGN